MKILKSWLQDYIEETLPDDEIISNAFISKSSEIESVEKIKVGDKDDTVFDLKVLPDRAHYMLSHRGVAYDLCACLNLTFKPRDLEIPKKDTDLKIKIESELCNRYSAVYISNITNTASPDWLKNRLEAIGARSINSIVDSTNFAMFDTGQPLHAFDADKVSGNISIRLAKDGEKIETLDGKNILLKSHHLIIADEEGLLALAGIKGGKKAEVTLNTKNIIIESANFNSVSIRKTSAEVGIHNDSSKRFENEISAHLTQIGISRCLDTIEKLFLDCKIGLLNDIYKVLPESWTVSVSHLQIESILNLSISEKRIIEILEKLQCKVSLENKIYKVIPSFERLDLIIAEDIIDEIGRIEGLDKVKSIIPKVKTNNIFDKEFLLIEKIKDFFVLKGFSEIITRTFADKGDIEVSYPMASDKGFLRTNLSNGISNSLILSIKNSPLLGLEKVQIFEIGKVFSKTGEQIDLCFAIDYTKKIKNKDITIKNELELILKDLESEIGIKFDSTIASNYIYIKNLEKINIDLDLNSIKIDKGSRIQFTPFSNEPFIVRDIALFVESSVSTEEVGKVIKESLNNNANELLVKGPDLFDQFEKENKKSLAFRMIFQSMNRTLTDDEINKIMGKVYESVKEKGWQVR